MDGWLRNRRPLADVSTERHNPRRVRGRIHRAGPASGKSTSELSAHLLHRGTTIAIAAILLLIWEGQPPHGCHTGAGIAAKLSFRLPLGLAVYFFAAFTFAQRAR